MNSISIGGFLQALRILPAIDQNEGKSAPPLPSNSEIRAIVQSAASSSTPLPEICLKMVAQHDSHDDCWIIVYDRVYDVTRFLADHPGGQDIIIDYAGRDATLAFHGTGHSRDALQQMHRYLIGELPVQERIFRTQTGRVLSKGVPE